MADPIQADSNSSTLSGVARVLVNAGKLDAKTAEDIIRAAKEQKKGFVPALIASGAIKAADLAHTLSKALAVPVLDLPSPGSRSTAPLAGWPAGPAASEVQVANEVS